MFNRRDIVYIYDGSFYGLMSAVFECYYNHELPVGIKVDKNLQMTVFCDYFHVATDDKKAERVINSIISKISDEALYHIFCAYLSNIADKELFILNFIRVGYKFGASVINRLNIDCVSEVMNTSKQVFGEAHLYRGFVRFRKLENGVYFAEIEPKGRVLPLVMRHFCERFSSMPFMICDLTHKECLVYNGQSSEIREFDSIPELVYSKEEDHFKDMWCEFYNTIEIKERHNEKCRMNLMPKHYWKYMTEVNSLV